VGTVAEKQQKIVTFAESAASGQSGQPRGRRSNSARAGNLVVENSSNEENYLSIKA
jgi:hypothetical protein